MGILNFMDRDDSVCFIKIHDSYAYVTQSHGYNQIVSLDETRSLIQKLRVFVEGVSQEEIDNANYEDEQRQIEEHARRQNCNYLPEVLKDPKPTYVYLMTDTNTGFTKIGTAQNPEYRERTLQSEKPTIEMFYVQLVTSNEIETKLHDIYANQRVRGEWFDLNHGDIANIKLYLEQAQLKEEVGMR